MKGKRENKRRGKVEGEGKESRIARTIGERETKGKERAIDRRNENRAGQQGKKRD
jgi:hypothetical protein